MKEKEEEATVSLAHMADRLHMDINAMRNRGIKDLFKNAYKEKGCWRIPVSDAEAYFKEHRYDWVHRNQTRGKAFAIDELENYRRICMEYFRKKDEQYGRYMKEQETATWYALMGAGCTPETADEAIEWTRECAEEEVKLCLKK